MKRKHYNILTVVIWIIALIIILGFNDPYTIGLPWNLFLGIFLTIVGFIISYAANKCPYCDRQIPNRLFRPAEFCPYCGSDISDL